LTGTRQQALRDETSSDPEHWVLLLHHRPERSPHNVLSVSHSYGRSRGGYPQVLRMSVISCLSWPEDTLFIGPMLIPSSWIQGLLRARGVELGVTEISSSQMRGTRGMTHETRNISKTIRALGEPFVSLRVSPSAAPSESIETEDVTLIQALQRTRSRQHQARSTYHSTQGRGAMLQ